MKRTLILHIGAHRTATSALQAYLRSNGPKLVNNGFLYPLNVRRHVKLMNDLFQGTQRVGDVGAMLNKRADKRSAPIHTIILSDEDICMRKDLSLLAEFRDHFDVKVVFTLRRQDTWLESWFFQNIKWQWNPKLSHCTFEEFLNLREDFHWIHYDRYVQHLESVFGYENLILNVMEKAQMPNGPIAAFCDGIGLTDRSTFTDPPHMNESYSPSMSEFMRCLPLDAAPNAYRNVLTKACATIDRDVLGNTQKQSEKLMSPAQREAVLAEYETGNRAIAARYFERDTLFLEPLPSKEQPLAQMVLPTDSYDLMRNMVSPLISALIAHHTAEQKAAEEGAQGEKNQGSGDTA